MPFGPHTAAWNASGDRAPAPNAFTIDNARRLSLSGDSRDALMSLEKRMLDANSEWDLNLEQRALAMERRSAVAVALQAASANKGRKRKTQMKTDR